MSKACRSAILAAVIALILMGTARPMAAEKANSMLAFERLTSLVGEWKMAQGDTEVKLLYTLVANGSTLMEELRPATEAPMMTMFTVDGDHLVATRLERGS